MIPRQILATLVLMMALGLGVSLSACNTIAGAGEDVQAAGTAVEKSAESTKESL